MFDKYGMLQNIIDKLDAIADAHGIAKCALITETIQMILALRKGLKSNDEANQKNIEMMRKQIENGPTVRDNGDGTETIGGDHFELDLRGDSDHETQAE